MRGAENSSKIRPGFRARKTAHIRHSGPEQGSIVGRDVGKGLCAGSTNSVHIGRARRRYRDTESGTSGRIRPARLVLAFLLWCCVSQRPTSYARDSHSGERVCRSERRFRYDPRPGAGPDFSPMDCYPAGSMDVARQVCHAASAGGLSLPITARATFTNSAARRDNGFNRGCRPSRSAGLITA